jgi:hypothetical protein
MSQTLLVNKKDFAELAVVSLDDGPLEAGCIRVKIGPWALTANNVTYMVTGDQIGYWHYFAPQAYDIQMDETDGIDWGRMPVWGFAAVTESRVEGISEGAKIYGFFPVADQIDLRPIKLSPLGFQDGTEHRTKLHSVYNSYSFTEGDPSLNIHTELQPVLRPLFTTSFLIEDFLADEDFFGADQVLLLSASSKTALGTAFCLKRGGRIKVAGLTGARNEAFVNGTGFYDEVKPYGELSGLDPALKTAVVDMAGNGEVMAQVYEHFGDNIVYNCMVGKSHWQGERPPKPQAGAAPVMFFAPDRAKLRFSDWGAKGFAENLGARWIPFLGAAKDWLTIENHSGVEPLLENYKALLDGESLPDKGHLFTL